MTLFGRVARFSSRFLPAIAVAATLAASHAGAQQKLMLGDQLRPPFPTIDLGARQSSGQDAIDRLGIHLPDVASWYGKTAEELRKEIMTDRALRVDKGGRILFVELLAAGVRAEQATGTSQATNVQDGALVGLDQTFYLHSHPGATRTIYLDFNGASITNTAWNSNGNTITAVPYDIDGNPASFSTTELQRIQYIWQRVAEDYAPFDVDVTTQPPTQDKLTRTDVNDQVFGTTVVITKTTGVYSCSCGGIAYVGVFNQTGGTYPPDYYKPAFVFYDMLANGDEKAVAEAISHEAGHNMGLHHDGTSVDTYYAGQGSDAKTGWAPIMGAGYYKPLVQFSKGEYSGASNKEDDFAIAQNFGLPMRLDDYGSTIAAATPFAETVSGSSVSGTMDGVIEKSADRDVFAISAGVGAINATVVPASRSPDVDVVLNLLDGTGKVLATANPLNDLSAVLYANIPTQGKYYLEVKGTGQGDAVTTGYSNYGSVGNFRVTANYVAPTGTAPTAVIVATPTSGTLPLAVKLDGTTSRDDGKVAFWYWDFGDGNSDQTGTLSSITHTYQVAGSYLARLTVVDDSGLTSNTTQVINVTSASPRSSVQSIQMSTKINSMKYVWAVGVVTVVDQNGKVLPNAKVAASWAGIVSSTVTATTSSTGKVTLSSPKTKASGCFNLTVTNITLSGYTFNAAPNRTAQICK